ncbi:hypothetical protein AKJ16_DCAP13879 [Drosera capensis]
MKTEGKVEELELGFDLQGRDDLRDVVATSVRLAWFLRFRFGNRFACCLKSMTPVVARPFSVRLDRSHRSESIEMETWFLLLWVLVEAMVSMDLMGMYRERKVMAMEFDSNTRMMDMSYSPDVLQQVLRLLLDLSRSMDMCALCLFQRDVPRENKGLYSSCHISFGKWSSLIVASIIGWILACIYLFEEQHSIEDLTRCLDWEVVTICQGDFDLAMGVEGFGFGLLFFLPSRTWFLAHHLPYNMIVTHISAFRDFSLFDGVLFYVVTICEGNFGLAVWVEGGVEASVWDDSGRSRDFDLLFGLGGCDDMSRFNLLFELGGCDDLLRRSKHGEGGPFPVGVTFISRRLNKSKAFTIANTRPVVAVYHLPCVCLMLDQVPWLRPVTTYISTMPSGALAYFGDCWSFGDDNWCYDFFSHGLNVSSFCSNGDLL